MKQLLMWVLLLGWSLPLLAQQPNKDKTPEERADLKMKRLSERYELSADQQARLQPELLKTEKTIANKRELAKEARYANETARAEQHAAIVSVLTPEQKKQFDADVEKIKEKQRARKTEAWHKGTPKNH